MYIKYTCIDGHLCLLPIINIWHNKKYSILFYSNFFFCDILIFFCLCWSGRHFYFLLSQDVFLICVGTAICLMEMCICDLLWSFYALCHNILEMFTVFHLVYQEWDKYHCYSYDCFHDLCSIIMILIFIMLIEHVHV